VLLASGRPGAPRVAGLEQSVSTNRGPRRFDLSEEERRRIAEVRRGPVGVRETARILMRSPGIAGEIVRSIPPAVKHGLQDAVIFSLIDAERARMAVPDAASGAAWVDERPFLRILLPSLEEEMRVFDLGGGAGRLTRHVAPRVREVVVGDASPTLLAEARRNLAAFTNVGYFRNRGFSLAGLRDAEFDLVFAQGVFSYFDPNPLLAMLSEVRRVLGEGGSLIFNVFTIERPEWARRAVEEVRSGLLEGRPRPGLYRAYTESQIVALCEAAGLVVRERVYEGEDLYPGGHLACVFVAEAKPDS
jgi:SAM-dependent methyltransferase